MNRSELFDFWAPASSTWARWAKPVLFANMPEIIPERALPTHRAGMDASWAPGPAEGSAIILDLPGPDSVYWGLALARRGYRPVPLFNTTSSPGAVISVDEIVAALQECGPLLAQLRIDDDAPQETALGPARASPVAPVFLLDAGRLGAIRPSPGSYDNRWTVYPQDFPSGAFLRSCGVRRVLVVRSGARRMEDDLRHVLVRWSKAGLELVQSGVQSEVQSEGAAGGFIGTACEPLAVSAPLPWGFLPGLGLVLLGLRRNSAGGFGARVPQPSSGGG